MGCATSHPEVRITDELNRLCERIEDSKISNKYLEMMAISALHEISEHAKRSYSLRPGVRTKLLFVRDLMGVSRREAFTECVRHEFEVADTIVLARTIGSGGSPPRRREKVIGGNIAKNDDGDGCTITTEERPSVKYEDSLSFSTNSEGTTNQNHTNSPPLSPANNTSPMRKKDRTQSLDSDATAATLVRFKSLYLSPVGSVSQETLGDFGFFDEVDHDADPAYRALCFV